MKKRIGFFIRKLERESGVMVSVRHLKNNLDKAGFPAEICWYADDGELLELVRASEDTCINLHVPNFRDETMEKLLDMHDNLVLSIHSTICNLQTEGDAFSRLLRLGNSGIRNLRFTCPSLEECIGLNAVTEGRYIYLPNTFSYAVDEKEVLRRISEKCGSLLYRPLRISLFCEYRPLKNILPQAAAVVRFAEMYQREVELHVFSPAYPSPIFTNVENICRCKGVRLIVHERMGNEECVKLQSAMDIGLQVSLSETLSYVAFEQMAQGVPVIGSDSIPFATLRPSYSSVREICDCIFRISENPDKYRDYCVSSLEKALRFNKDSITHALEAAERMVNRNE